MSPSAALHPRHCWFKANLSGAGPCEGPLQRAHLIRAQVIRKEISDEFEVMWDPRAWVPGCLRHHGMLDHSRQLRIPRAVLPASVEEFARDYPAVAFWLDREYGPMSIEWGGTVGTRHIEEFWGCIE